MLVLVNELTCRNTRKGSRQEYILKKIYGTPVWSKLVSIQGTLAGLVMRQSSRSLRSSGSLGQELHGSRTSRDKWLKEQGQRPASREREEQAEIRGRKPSQTVKGDNQSHLGN